jgi:hypothetical protein
MRLRTILAAGIAAVVAVAAAGCGGGGTAQFAPASSATLGAGAVVAPADTAAFAALDTSAASAQRQALDGLLAKIPQSDTLLTKLRQSLEQKTGLSWSADVKPALGPELDVVVLPAASGGKPQAVLLTQPADPSKLAALLQKLTAAGGSAPLTAQAGGWTAISDSTSALDAVSGATKHLADDSLYQAARGKLAPDSLLEAYANGAEARQLVASLGGSAGVRAGHLVWAAADAVAAEGGLKVDGLVRSDAAGPQPYAASLVDEIPASALLVADFQARQDTTPATAPASPFRAALARLRDALGGETAVYVTPAAPIPAVTLVTHPSDPQAVLGALHDALGAAGSVVGGAKAGGLDLGSLLGALELSHAQVGSALVVSTSQQAVDAFRSSGGKLADDSAFKRAQSASGMPDRTTGFVYANLQDALPVVKGLASLAGATLPAGGHRLSALRTLTAYGSGGSGGVSSFTLFLEVR